MPDGLGLGGHRFERLFVFPLLVERQAVCRGFGCEIVVVPKEVAPVVFHAEPEPVGLGHIQAAVIAEGDGGGGGYSGVCVASADHEANAGRNRRASLSFNSDKFLSSIWFCRSRGGEIHLGLRGKHKMICSDQPHLRGRAVHHPDDGFFAFQVRDVPHLRTQRQIALPDCLANHGAVDDQLDRCFAGLLAACDEEGEVGLGQGECG